MMWLKYFIGSLVVAAFVVEQIIAIVGMMKRSRKVRFEKFKKDALKRYQSPSNDEGEYGEFRYLGEKKICSCFPEYVVHHLGFSGRGNPFLSRGMTDTLVKVNRAIERIIR